MIVKEILYHPAFIKDLKRLDSITQARAIQIERIFRENPLHPSLRLHQLKGALKGLWSISVTMSIRIIFKRMPKGEIVFLSVGRHDVYRNL